jgi:hypothetical protein
MTNHHSNTAEVLETASGMLADGTAAAPDLATTAAHNAATWADKAPGQAKGMWEDVVSNVDDLLPNNLLPGRARRRRRRTWLIVGAAAVVVAVGIAVTAQRRKAAANDADSAPGGQ